ncbi:MAG: hypothetical protein LOD90_05265 [Symbiobacteriaceae bacterium]
MSDVNNNQTPAPADPQPAPEPSPAPQPNPQPEPKPQGRVYSEDYVRTLRDEAAGYRTRLRATEAAIRQALGLAQDAALPDDIAAALNGLREAGKREAEKVAERARAALLKAAFVSAAAGKVVDVEDAFALASQELANVEVDLESATVKVKPGPDGKERTMADLVEALLQRKPHLRAQAAAAGVGGTAPAGGASGQESPQEIARRIAEQRKAARGEGKSFWDRYRKGV